MIQQCFGTTHINHWTWSYMYIPFLPVTVAVLKNRQHVVWRGYEYFICTLHNKWISKFAKEIKTTPPFIIQLGILTIFPQCSFSREFPGMLSQNLICHHWLSVSGNSEIMHCRILINMPYYSLTHQHKTGTWVDTSDSALLYSCWSWKCDWISNFKTGLWSYKWRIWVKMRENYSQLLTRN